MKLNLLYVSSQKNKSALFLEDDLVKRIKSPLKLELKKIFCKTESNNIEQQKIFESEQIKKFLDVLKMEYDYVIVDSPPVQPVSDTLILTQASDYNLFVIRSEETRTVSFMSSIKKIQNVGAKINGIIINDLDTSKDSYYSYYYSYSPQYYYHKN